MYLFTNVLGAFVFDEKFNAVDSILFKNIEEYKNKEKSVEKLKSKHKSLKEADENSLKSILLHFKSANFFSDFYNKNIELTKIDLRNSVTKDILLMQSINSVEEIDKAASILIKRLREWYQLHNPEFSRATDDNEEFVKEILDNEKNELLGKLKINPKDSVGADLAQEDLEPIRSLAHQVHDLIQLKKLQIE
jgi:RNA processing factor Prp31